MTRPERPLEAIDVTCPTCCAKPGWPCRTRASMDEGVVRNLAQRYGERYPHAARLRRAASPLPGGKETK